MPFQEFGGLDSERINDTFNESLSGDKGVFYHGPKLINTKLLKTRFMLFGWGNVLTSADGITIPKK